MCKDAFSDQQLTKTCIIPHRHKNLWQHELRCSQFIGVETGVDQSTILLTMGCRLQTVQISTDSISDQGSSWRFAHLHVRTSFSSLTYLLTSNLAVINRSTIVFTRPLSSSCWRARRRRTQYRLTVWRSRYLTRPVSRLCCAWRRIAGQIKGMMYISYWFCCFKQLKMLAGC